MRNARTCMEEHHWTSEGQFLTLVKLEGPENTNSPDDLRDPKKQWSTETVRFLEAVDVL